MCMETYNNAAIMNMDAYIMDIKTTASGTGIASIMHGHELRDNHPGNPWAHLRDLAKYA